MKALLSYRSVTSTISGLVATGGYVSYKDLTRYPRMEETYSTGNILPPMAENSFETVYFRRPELEEVVSCIHSLVCLEVIRLLLMTDRAFIGVNPGGAGVTTQLDFRV